MPQDLEILVKALMQGSEHPFLRQPTENVVLISQKINPEKVKFSYVGFGKIELEDKRRKEAQFTAGPFLSREEKSRVNPFICNILDVTPLFGIFWRPHHRLSQRKKAAYAQAIGGRGGTPNQR
jgi:hypothetical protein